MSVTDPMGLVCIASNWFRWVDSFLPSPTFHAVKIFAILLGFFNPSSNQLLRPTLDSKYGVSLCVQILDRGANMRKSGKLSMSMKREWQISLTISFLRTIRFVLDERDIGLDGESESQISNFLLVVLFIFNRICSVV